MSASPPGLRPAWLRPAAVGSALSAHAALVGVFLLAGDPPSAAYDSHDVSYVQEGDAAPLAQAESTPEEQLENAQSDVTQAAAQAQAEAAPKTQQQAENPLALEKPQTVAPDAVTLAETKQREEDPLNPTLKPKVQLAKLELPQTPDETPTEKTAAVRQTASAEAEAAAAAAAAERAGAADGKNAPSSAARARYGSKVLVEIQKHMFYPRLAKKAGVTGTAAIVFTVGADGHIVERRLERSTGSPELDHAALAMMDATVAPPPPLGRFQGRTTIKFDVKR
ncbi:energy transducer TonB family protein [Methylocystis heyeri]|uniref:TonB family protein n=1 Tax=Methylocystis heyeri TaxID=391905 RepID=A0A6B8KEV6_9HYPH|nr:TonB family protein [Methylocystis heyeri]QGM45108.1 TonB family protein [Methylocystis heyeri]